MELTLEFLGCTKEQLLDLVVNKIASEMLNQSDFGDEGEEITV